MRLCTEVNLLLWIRDALLMMHVQLQARCCLLLVVRVHNLEPQQMIRAGSYAVGRGWRLPHPQDNSNTWHHVKASGHSGMRHFWSQGEARCQEKREEKPNRGAAVAESGKQSFLSLRLMPGGLHPLLLPQESAIDVTFRRGQEDLMLCESKLSTECVSARLLA